MCCTGFSFIEFMQSAINFKYDNGIEVMDIGIISGSNNGFKNAQFQREANYNKLRNSHFPS